jgi:hypothetical protein
MRPVVHATRQAVAMWEVQKPVLGDQAEGEMMDSLVFDHVIHRYCIGERVLPSVTQIINAVIPRTYQPDPWYMQLGTMVHKAVALMLRGDLDEESVDPRIAGYVMAANSFLAQQPIEVCDHMLEIPLCDPKRGFAGTPDVTTDAAIIDWKSGTVDDVTEIQTGGYAVLTSPIAPRRRRLMAVELHEDGTYKIYQYEERRAYGLFLNVLSVYQWMQKNGRLPKGEL